MHSSTFWKAYGGWIALGIAVNAAAVAAFELTRSSQLGWDGLYAARAGLFGGLLLFDNLCVLGWYAHLTRRSVEIAHSAALQQAWFTLRQQYRSAEILYAIRTLWDFKRSNVGEDLAGAYQKQLDADKQSLNKLPAAARADFLRGTLDFQRRLLSDFYQDVAVLSDFTVPRQLIYTQWVKHDLSIISEVLMPIELHLGPETGSLKRMQALYENAPN